MLARVSIAVLAAGVAAGLASWTGGFAAPGPTVLTDNRATALTVDAELVIAVDVSNSMDPEEQALQREGYLAGLTSREFLNAVREGAHGRIAVIYFEWAGPMDQKIILPWRLIDGPESASAAAAEIAAAPYRRAPRTSIYGALQFAKRLFSDASGYRGLRRIIDVSGDGINNIGLPVTLMRDEVVDAGITINGLPIMLNRAYGGVEFANLDVYYEDCVIGGPGAFVVAIHQREQFKEATRTKLVLEIAGRTPAPRVIPARDGKPRVACS
jgi:hypothetical protein